MQYRYLFFDLDGTLWDSREGITKAVRYALEQMGYGSPDLKDLYKFIGPPLTEAFPEYYGMTMEQAREGVTYFREYFTKTGIYQNRLFDGVPEMLKTLKDAGRILCTASYKPEAHVKITLDSFHIADCFDYICGATLDESRSGKKEVLKELIRRLGLTEEQLHTEVLMIGDRKHDVQGAAAFGIPCLGTSMGFAPEGELESAGALAVVDNLQEMTDYILNH